MCHRYTAVATVSFQHGFHAIKLAVIFFAFQQIEHVFHKVINIEQLQLGAAVIHCEFFIVSHCLAEGTNCTVVLWATVPHQVREAINSYLCASLLGVVKEEFLSSLFAAAILAITKLPGQRRLNRT